ncbi:hypothetical protein I79_023635 [Cricetulus griseus]|uniref:Uncharacterized protein n=1 Tax=Cricetulus griseus TaxID=10029 RepID=G3IIG5_CRIGR|nr:hypothetical protein I79_023635 [Cricetulus griseus]
MEAGLLQGLGSLWVCWSLVGEFKSHEQTSGVRYPSTLIGQGNPIELILRAFRDHMEILGYLGCQVQRVPKEMLGCRQAKLLLEKRAPKDIQVSPDSVGNKVFQVTLETEALPVWTEVLDNQVTQDPRDHLALQDQR